MKRSWPALLILFSAMFTLVAGAQTVAPVIVEYSEKGEGTILLTNSSLSTLVAVLEPRSFSITPDGTGVYRPLDPTIHVSLSTMSVRLLPKQSYTVFYKASATKLPAWFTVYCGFSAPQRGPGVNLRIMLPHTVYLYQKKPMPRESIDLANLQYDAAKKRFSFDIENKGSAYGRVRSGVIDGNHDTMDVGGFPLLPGSPRHVEIEWTGKQPPRQLRLHFDNFDLKQQVPPPATPPDLSMTDLSAVANPATGLAIPISSKPD